MDRAFELLKLEKEGRLVVLPCKIDQPIYTLRGIKKPMKPMEYCVDECQIDHFTIGGAMMPMITACNAENEWYELIDGTQLGHEYFLSREEAETALEKEVQ